MIISGDLHLGLGKFDRSSGTGDVLFNHTFSCLKEACGHANNNHDNFLQTGDVFNSPVVDPFVAKIVSATLADIAVTVCPVGNHECFKSEFRDEIGMIQTSWKNLIRPYDHMQRVGPDYLMVLDYAPEGQKQAEHQFGIKLSQSRVNQRRSTQHLLVVAHHLFDGVHEYFGVAPPANENWFKKEWCYELSKSGYKSVTVVLGHDHVPKDYKVGEVSVYNIGSPTSLHFNDHHTRRFLKWDPQNGSMKEIPVLSSIKHCEIDNLEEFLKCKMKDNMDRVLANFELKDSKQEHRFVKRLDWCKKNGIEVVDKTNFFKQTEIVDGTNVSIMSHSVKDEFDLYAKEVNLLKNVTEKSKEFMDEVGL